MARRSLLAALLGAPFAARAAADVGTAVQAVQAQEPMVGYGPGYDPARQAASRYLRARMNRFEWRQRSTDSMPAHIAGKRSWSAVYKNHVWAQEQAQAEHLRALWEGSTDEIIAAAIRAGWSGL